jgi:hypothetical protein
MNFTGFNEQAAQPITNATPHIKHREGAGHSRLVDTAELYLECEKASYTYISEAWQFYLCRRPF